MSIKISNGTRQPTFQLKGTMLAITVFELAHFNIEQLTKELTQKIQEAPEFFETIPMVLSIDKLDIALSSVELKGLISLFQEHHIQLMALRTDNKTAITMAHKLGLVILPPTGAREKLIEIAVNRPITDKPIATDEHPPTITETTEQQQQLAIDETITDVATNEAVIPTLNQVASTPTNEELVTTPPVIEETTKQPPQTPSTKLITTPIRSGQQVEATNNDLIVTSNVSTGAELIADGNIHIYGTMRGRAMAGYHGNNKARVFCHKLTAELISIAGQIITEEELRRHPLWGKPAQVSLEDNRLTITAL